MNRQTRRMRGFTLLEIMVVLVIIGILATAVILNIGGDVDKAAVTRVQSDLQTLSTALERYKMDNFTYPTEEQSLAALVRKPTEEPLPRNYKQGGYINKLQKDPWGYDYVYRFPGEHGEFDLISYGADGQEGGEGPNADIGNWDQNLENQ